jgi:pimeloyl-ACP methyl ester carboxylesterase
LSEPGTATVVYVHGLWLSGYEAFLLRRRVIETQGFDWHSFSYASTLLTMDEIATALAEFVARIDAPTVHLVGHSLGGVAILRYIERNPEFPPGRVVFMGTPAQPSRVAASVARFMFGRMLLGQAASDELLHQHQREWQSARELGLIIGTQPYSFGRLFAEFNEPNDGTVAVSETEVPGAKARIMLPESHTGMLLSARVAQEVGSFLATGYFTA